MCIISNHVSNLSVHVTTEVKTNKESLYCPTLLIRVVRTRNTFIIVPPYVAFH